MTTTRKWMFCTLLIFVGWLLLLPTALQLAIDLFWLFAGGLGLVWLAALVLDMWRIAGDEP